MNTAYFNVANTSNESEDTITFTLPMWFAQNNSTHKSVSVLAVHLYRTDEHHVGEPINATLHSDIAQFDPSVDSMICVTNTIYATPKKYPMPTHKQTFDAWFRAMDDTILDIRPSVVKAIIELELQW